MTRVQAIKKAETFPKHTMSILTIDDGDREVTWNPDDSGSVAIAEKEFSVARANGLTGVSVGEDGQGSEVIRTFEPDAHAIVMAPQIIGG